MEVNVVKKNRKLLLFCIVLPLAVGGISALFTSGSMDIFSQLNQPPLTPPAFVFPLVWTILYLLMGIASYLVISSQAPADQIRQAALLYLLQLAVNFFWPLFFFSLGWYLFSFIWLLLLWLLILAVINQFSSIDSRAAWLMVPHLLWTTFAGYLNLAVYLLS